MVSLALQILDGIDLKSMGHYSPKTIHTVLQAIELAMADREATIGDPRFVQVPIQALLDPRYAAVRRTRMTPGKAFTQMLPAEDPLNLSAVLAGQVPLAASSNRVSGLDSLPVGKDTSYLRPSTRLASNPITTWIRLRHTFTSRGRLAWKKAFMLPPGNSSKPWAIRFRSMEIGTTSTAPPT